MFYYAKMYKSNTYFGFMLQIYLVFIISFIVMQDNEENLINTAVPQSLTDDNIKYRKMSNTEDVSKDYSKFTQKDIQNFISILNIWEKYNKCIKLDENICLECIKARNLNKSAIQENNKLETRGNNLQGEVLDYEKIDEDKNYLEPKHSLTCECTVCHFNEENIPDEQIRDKEIDSDCVIQNNENLLDEKTSAEEIYSDCIIQNNENLLDEKTSAEEIYSDCIIQNNENLLDEKTSAEEIYSDCGIQNKELFKAASSEKDLFFKEKEQICNDMTKRVDQDLNNELFAFIFNENVNYGQNHQIRKKLDHKNNFDFDSYVARELSDKKKRENKFISDLSENAEICVINSPITNDIAEKVIDLASPVFEKDAREHILECGIEDDLTYDASNAEKHVISQSIFKPLNDEFILPFLRPDETFEPIKLSKDSDSKFTFKYEESRKKNILNLIFGDNNEFKPFKEIDCYPYKLRVIIEQKIDQIFAYNLNPLNQLLENEIYEGNEKIKTIIRDEILRLDIIAKNWNRKLFSDLNPLLKSEIKTRYSSIMDFLSGNCKLLFDKSKFLLNKLGEVWASIDSQSKKIGKKGTTTKLKASSIDPQVIYKKYIDSLDITSKTMNNLFASNLRFTMDNIEAISILFSPETIVKIENIGAENYQDSKKEIDSTIMKISDEVQIILSGVSKKIQALIKNKAESIEFTISKMLKDLCKEQENNEVILQYNQSFSTGLKDNKQDETDICETAELNQIDKPARIEMDNCFKDSKEYNHSERQGYSSFEGEKYQKMSPYIYK